MSIISSNYPFSILLYAPLNIFKSPILSPYSFPLPEPSLHTRLPSDMRIQNSSPPLPCPLVFLFSLSPLRLSLQNLGVIHLQYLTLLNSLLWMAYPALTINTNFSLSHSFRICMSLTLMCQRGWVFPQNISRNI